MGIFDSIQNLVGGAFDGVAGSAGDVLGGLADNQTVQDIQDQAAVVTEGAAETVTSATEQTQSAIEDATQKLGL